MTPETIRQQFKCFLAQHLRIDRWGLNFPDQVQDPNYPPSIGREDPITKDIEVVSLLGGIHGPMLARMSLSYKVMFGFGENYKYAKIPKAQAETIMLQMLMRLRQFPECLSEEIEEIQATGKVTIAEIENKGWLLVYEFNLTPTFQAEINELEVTSMLMRSISDEAIVPEEVS